MGSKKTRKKQRKWNKRFSLTALFAFTLMFGAIIAGLLILSSLPQSDNSAITSVISAPQQPRDKTPISSVTKNPFISLPQNTHKTEQQTSNPPRVAIIMDDLGANVQKATVVATLDIPVTMSIIPTLGYAQESMHVAAKYEREIMIHIPMEPLNHPQHDPGEMALMLDMDDAKIRSTIAKLLHMLPYAVGCNNHMGSAFTQHPHQMSVALELIAERGLFFIDSLTSAASVGALEATRMHIPTATRDVFLDNDRDVAKINVQLTQLLQLAQKNGSAIGICHPYPETIIALKDCSTLAKRYGVTVVTVAELLN